MHSLAKKYLPFPSHKVLKREVGQSWLIRHSSLSLRHQINKKMKRAQERSDIGVCISCNRYNLGENNI